MKNQILTNNNETPSFIINELKNLIIKRKDEIDNWFNKASENAPPFFYNSVDLRHSGFKLAPVDTNLFPAGFNNLNDYEKQKAVVLTKDFLQKHFPKIKNILIITEDHTRNLYYLENIYILSSILENAGFTVKLSSIATYENDQEARHTTANGNELLFHPFVKKDSIITTKQGFKPDFILLNNDMTNGAPEVFKHLKQPISPPIELGWYQRRKTSHFEAYSNMAKDFAYIFGIDYWLISTYFARCGVVNFKEKVGLECVAIQVDKLISQIKEKYQQYSIKEQPYVFIKSDMGTYGMGIMTAKSGEDVLSIGKDIRKKMNIIKGGTLNNEVIIQEGIPTIDKAENNPAEPMIYLIGGNPVGCMYRMNTIMKILILLAWGLQVYVNIVTIKNYAARLDL